MGFFDDFAGADSHADLVLAVRIEGIPVAFVERAIPAAVATGLTGYTQFAGLTRIDEGEATLDVDERREMAATMQIELLDDDAKTLASLFALNRRSSTFLTANATAAATALTVDATAGLANGQTVYTDGETITIGTVASSTSLTGCTRGAFGSTAAALFGTPAGFEAPIYTAPPSWRSRRAFLYGYSLDARGSGSEALLGVWIVDSSPQHRGDLSWSMSFASVAQEYYDRSIGIGLSTATVLERPTFALVSGRQTYEYVVDNPGAFRLGNTHPTYALLRWQSIGCICEVYQVNVNSIVVYGEALFGTLQTISIFEGTETLQPIQIVASSSITSILMVLLSREGQNATVYDQLPGRLQTATDPGWRYGAGFTANEIDTASWTSWDSSRVSSVIIDQEQRLSDVLREWCLLNGAATRVTNDGKLAVFSLATPRVTSTTTLGADSVIPDSRVEVVADEAAIYPLAHVKADYSPFEADFRKEGDLVDTVAAKRHPRSQERREIEFRSIGVTNIPLYDVSIVPFTPPARMTIGELQQVAADIQRGEGGFARRFLSLSLTLAHLGLRIGDVVTLSSALPDGFAQLPDLRGGTLGGVQARVVSRRPRYDDGRVDVRLQVLDPLLLVAPAAAISSLVGSTLTLSTTGPEVSGASPANDFFANAAVRVYDVSAGVVHNTTVSSITSGTQLVVAAAPAFAGGIEAGVDYIVGSVSATTVSGTSVSGYTVAEWGALTNAAGRVTTTVGNTEPRWR
jgi:hypothetical protein